MFRCVYMTCTLHVYDVFDQMCVMVRMSLVIYCFKFCIRDLVFLLFIISENFMKFWAEALFLDLKRWLRYQGFQHKIV